MNRFNAHEIGFLIVIVGAVLVLIIYATDCSLYIWGHPDMLDELQRCGSQSKNDITMFLKELITLLLAYGAGRVSKDQ